MQVSSNKSELNHLRSSYINLNMSHVFSCGIYRMWVIWVISEKKTWEIRATIRGLRVDAREKQVATSSASPKLEPRSEVGTVWVDMEKTSPHCPLLFKMEVLIT
jgi:hypothetical protein